MKAMCLGREDTFQSLLDEGACYNVFPKDGPMGLFTVHIVVRQMLQGHGLFPGKGHAIGITVIAVEKNSMTLLV